MGKIEELKLGIMTNKELANWFDIKEKSFRSVRKKKLVELERYAEFEILRGKVNILRIKEPIYTKGSEVYKLIKKKTLEQWSDTNLDTCRLVADKIKNRYKNELNIKDSTLYSYTCKSKRELWGRAFKHEGEIGYCVYELCKKINNKCVEFTEEERNIKNKLLKKYFGNADEKILFVRDMLENGEIEENECWEELKLLMELDKNYYAFKTDVEEKIGETVVRATRVFTNAFRLIDRDFDF